MIVNENTNVRKKIKNVFEAFLTNNLKTAQTIPLFTKLFHIIFQVSWKRNIIYVII